jgi:hypothetical protein
MTQVLRGFGSDGSRVWDPTNKDQQEIFYEDLYSTKTWERFARDFGNTAENRQSIERVLDVLYPDEEITTLRFEDAIRTGMDSGALSRRPASPVANPTPVPTDKHGKPLTEPQRRWSEYTKFANEHSSSECRGRARTDAGFRSFVTKNLFREMNEEGVGDAVVPLNQSASPTKAGLKDERLVAFANAFRSMSSAEVKSRRSAASNPFGHAQFLEDLNACISLGLI